MAMGKVTKSFKVTLDIARSISNREFSVVEGDTGNTLSITLNDDGKAVDLTGCRVLALFSKSNGETVCQDSAEQNGGVTIGGQSMNEISIELFASSVQFQMQARHIERRYACRHKGISAAYGADKGNAGHAGKA